MYCSITESYKTFIILNIFYKNITPQKYDYNIKWKEENKNSSVAPLI